MEFRALKLSIQGGIGRLVFSDPARGNPIDGRLCAEISEAADQLSEHGDLRVLLITAEGPAFSYGGDIAMFTAHLDRLPVMIKRWTTDLHTGIARLQRMDAPIVAAVHGMCAGGMAGFIAGCDLVIASASARFHAAYAGIGFSCDAGSSIMLTRRMGAGRARRYLLLNETLDAAEALASGLIDEVVTNEDLADRAETVVQQLSTGPTLAFGETRRLLLSAHDQPLETQLELEAQALARVSGSADGREGLTAFAARRKPTFQGR
jgi:2-(1,2-epoxy-1,2-dihydrophenyl)acetyl-CoA isomerase